MERKRVQPEGPVEETFWSTQIVGLGTVETLPAKNMNGTVFHSLGLVTDDVFQQFFGLDVAPNVRLGLDYGVTDRWTFGIGRTTDQKVVDARSTYALLRQTKTNSTPVSVSLKTDIGLSTEENNQPVKDDLNYFVSIPVAKEINGRFSLHVTPMYSHFNTVNEIIGQNNDHFAVALAGEWHISKRFTVNAEYFPVVGSRSDGTTDAFAFGINVETGGHTFQIFLASSDGTTEQFIISHNGNDFWSGDFRFGFNINRLFFLGK